MSPASSDINAKCAADMLRIDAPKNCIAIELIVTCEGYSVRYETREAAALKNHMISMRNVQGEWIN